MIRREEGDDYDCIMTCDYPGCTNSVTGNFENPLDLFFRTRELYLWQSFYLPGRYYHFCARCFFRRVNKWLYRDYYLQTAHWKIKRLQAIQEADGFCEFCGSSYCLEVHHRTYENLGYEDLDDLMTLCHSCHMELHEELKETGEEE